MKGPRMKKWRPLAFSPSWTSRGQPAPTAGHGPSHLRVGLPAPVQLPQGSRWSRGKGSLPQVQIYEQNERLVLLGHEGLGFGRQQQ